MLSDPMRRLASRPFKGRTISVMQHPACKASIQKMVGNQTQTGQPGGQRATSALMEDVGAV